MSEKFYELKRCPFCGARAILERSTRAFVNGAPAKVAYVRCSKCEARCGKVPISDFGKTSRSVEAEAAAAEKWNARV